jgi:uncharacterized protein YbjT (DUF2867 family)
MEKNLIIGATGSVGFEVSKRLSELQEPVKIAVRDPEKAKSINLENVELIHFEYQNPETFNSTFENVNKIFLVSPPSYLNLQDDVIKTINFAIDKGIKYIVNLSAISVESDTDKPMKKIEEHIVKSGIDYVLLRPNFYMQNFNDLFRDFIIHEDKIIAPAGDSKTGFVDIRDVADVSVKVLLDNQFQNNTYKLTGQKLLNMHVVAYIFSECLNKEIEYNNVSEELFKKTLYSAGWPAGTIEGTLQLCQHVKKGETNIVTDDMKNILGKEPISFEKFVKDYSKIWL